MKKIVRSLISVILAFVICFSSIIISMAENKVHWKDKIDENIYAEAAEKDVVIPVYIWLTDVDHEEVIAETENTLGYGEADLEVVDEDISEELAAAICSLSEKEDDSVADELQEYMQKTEKKRKAEKEKTDKYISEKRNNYKEKYNKKSKDFLEKAKISEDDIIFRSQYAPMIIAELTIKQIEKVAKSDEVTDISLYEEFIASPQAVTATMDEVKSSTNIDKIHDIGLTGSGVKVGIYDSGNFGDDSELPANRFTIVYEDENAVYDTDNEKYHINRVSKICSGNKGIAPESDCYVISSKSFAYPMVEELITEGVQVINHSSVFSFELLYENFEKWIEHITSQHNVSFVQAAGNESGNIGSPGLAYNVITVGGYNNNATYSSSDDTIFFGSCYINTGYCEKPDVLANAYAFGKYGTSFSAPFVSGLIALMLELRPSLAAYPQAIKAILLASCHHKAASSPTETMVQGITEKQGAGVVDAYRAISITGRGNYGIREIGSGVTNTEVKFNVPKLYGATGLNISISWLKNNSISYSNHNTNTVTEDNIHIHNLNLSVLSGSTVVGSGVKENSSTEMVYISNPTAKTTYTAQITKADNVNTSVKVAYAWSFDEEQFQYTEDNEGVFFLKNKQSGKYLHYSDNNVKQISFVGSFYQQIIVQKRSNGKYTLNNFIGNTGCYDVDSSISGKYYAVSYNGSNTADVTVHNNIDGSVAFSKIINGQQYMLSVLNNSMAENSQIVWKRIDSATDIESCMYWYLESVCYQVGDVDMNGTISAADSRIVLNYSSGTGTLGSDTNINILTYLADANSDGAVNAIDARLILRFASGLE